MECSMIPSNLNQAPNKLLRRALLATAIGFALAPSFVTAAGCSQNSINSHPVVDCVESDELGVQYNPVGLINDKNPYQSFNIAAEAGKIELGLRGNKVGTEGQPDTAITLNAYTTTDLHIIGTEVKASNVGADVLSNEALKITLRTYSDKGSSITTDKNGTGIKAVSNNANVVLTVNSGSSILTDEGIGADITAGTTGELINGGNISGDIKISSAGDAKITNTGTIIGNITLAGKNNTFNNNDKWKLNKATEADFSLKSPVLAVPSSKLNNNGVISWDGDAAGNVTLKGLTDFNNNGSIDLSNKVTGDTFTIISGNYIGGTDSAITLEAVLGSDDKGNTDIADTLVLNNVNITGSTAVNVINLGGQGNSTGKVLLVAGKSSKASTTGSEGHDEFVLKDPVNAGSYEYNKLEYTTIGATTGWYFSAISADGTKVITPAIPAYLANQNAAINMFSLSMHDRIGEPRYTEAYRPNSYTKKRAQSLWLRVSGARSTSDMINGSTNVRNYLGVTQIGGDVASWDNDVDRLHLGFIAGFGENHAKTHSNVGAKSIAKGKVKGYSMGLYATWFKNNKQNTGFYVDTWTQLNSFSNEVTSGSAPADHYRSHQWNNSVEAGYNLLAYRGKNRQLFIEPQGQIIYQMYSSKDHSNTTGLTVSGGKFDSYETRLGLRTYLSNQQKENAVQPFMTLNWYNNQKVRGLKFNDERMTGGVPGSRYEIKLGAEGEATKRVQLYGHISQTWGSSDKYRNSEGMLGVKAMF